MKVLGKGTQGTRVTQRRLPELSASSLGPDKLQAILNRKSPSLVSSLEATYIIIKLMRQRQIKTLFGDQLLSLGLLCGTGLMFFQGTFRCNREKIRFDLGRGVPKGGLL